MIEFIKGKVLEITPTEVVVDGQPFGYRVQISLNTFDEIKPQKSVLLYVYLQVKNEGQNLSGFELFGFATKLEREYFKAIIGVSGIGASTARLMLSSLKTSEIYRAILLEDDQTITKVKGIGPKTAKRLILELKDKIYKLGEGQEVELEQQEPVNNTIANEALTALTMLGFSKQAAQKAIDRILKQDKIDSVEELVKECLKKL